MRRSARPHQPSGVVPGYQAARVRRRSALRGSATVANSERRRRCHYQAVSDVRVVQTHALSDSDRKALRRLLDEAYEGEFSDEDWMHALGGWHAIVGDAASPVAHASVVERRMIVGARELRAGYVEAVATFPTGQRTGLGTIVMQAIGNLIRAGFDLGVLSTGEHAFYQRLGWEHWRGPSYVRAVDGTTARSADDDDGIMVLRCVASKDLDATTAIVCDARSGDSW